MLPWLAIMGFLLYQRYLHPSDDSLLIYALGCLLVGVVFGGLIVGASGAADNEVESGESTDSASESTDERHESRPIPDNEAKKTKPVGTIIEQENAAKIELKTAKDPSTASPVSTGSNDLFDNATTLSLGANPNEGGANEALARELLSPISEKPTSYGAAVESFAPGLQFTPVADEPIVKLVPVEQSEEAADSAAPAVTASSSIEAESKKVEINAEINATETAKADTESKERKESASKEPVSAAQLNSENILAAEQNVDRAQLVVARLEAEVAKAEAVAAKLEVELAKAEPMAARLQSAERAIQDAHLQARIEGELAQNFKTDNKPQASKNAPLQQQQAKSQAQSQSGKTTPPQQNKNQKSAKVKTSETKLPELKTVEAWLNHAEKMLAEDNFDAAIRCYDQATKIEIKSFDAWYLKAVALRKKSLYEDALYCINYALGIKNQSSDALAEKGECLLELGKAEQALVWFEKSLTFDKVAPKPWLGKGRCLALMKRHKDAVACFDKVLAMQPDNEKAKEAKKISAAKIGVKN